MPNIKISDLSNVTPSGYTPNDLLVIVNYNGNPTGVTRNTKISDITNYVLSGFTGTTNYVSKWTTSSNLGDSQIFDNGTNVGIGTSSPNAKLEIKSDSSTGNTIYPFSVNQSDNSKVFYLSNQNYYSSTNNLGVYSNIYDNKFQIDLSGGVSQFKLNYGDSSFQMNPYPAVSNTRFLFKTNPSGGGYESGILHIFRGGNGNNGNLLIGEHLQIGTVTGGTGSTIYGKYIQKSNFDNPTTTFYPLVVLDGNSGFGTSSPSETLEIVGKTKTTNLQVTSGSPQIGYVLTSTDTNGNMTWQEPQDLTKQGTGLTIHFSGKTIFNLPTSPESGNVSGDTTNAKLGMIQKIYHQSSVEPTFPVTWKLVGEGVYFTDELNIIYAEYVTDMWIEYWIIQQQ